MRVTVDPTGRVLVPKALREALGLVAGTTVDVSAYGTGVFLSPTGRTAKLVTDEGELVADGGGSISDDDVFAALDAGRR